MRFTVSASAEKSQSPASLTAAATTPGPLTPTLTTESGSPIPWTAPAINGLSSGILENTTSFAHPSESRSAVRSEVCFTIRPIRLTASILIPALVEATLTDEHTFSVTASASGIDAISASAPRVIPFCTNAE